jgi:hypothetical protein
MTMKTAIARTIIRYRFLLPGLDGRVKALEDNTLLAGWREYQVSVAKHMFDPEENLKKWEGVLKDRLQKQAEDTK